MPHAILLFYLKEKKKRETINETGESLRRHLGCVNTEIKHETGPGDSWRTDGGRIGEGNGERFEDGERNKNTDCGRHRRDGAAFHCITC